MSEELQNSDNEVPFEEEIRVLVKALAQKLKDTRIDVNTMAKYFKDENVHLKGSIEKIIEDTQNIDDTIGALAEEVEKIQKDVSSLLNFGGGSAGGNVSDSALKAIFEDMAERDNKLVERVQQIVNEALGGVKAGVKAKPRKKFLGIF